VSVCGRIGGWGRWFGRGGGSGVCPLKTASEINAAFLYRGSSGESPSIPVRLVAHGELARVSHHRLDIVTPPAALFPIEDYIRYRNLRHRRLTGSLKSNRPDQVVSIVTRQAPSWFRLGPGGSCGGLLGHIFRGKQCRACRCVAPLLSYLATW